MRRSVLLVSIVSVLAACGGGTGDGRPDSGVRGVVLMGPACPVATRESPCPDVPFLGGVRAVGEGTRALGATDEAGRFVLDLEPGIYVVQAVVEGGAPPTAIPRTVTVRPDEFTEVTLAVDTGIR